MSSSELPVRVIDRVTDQRNVTRFTAILVGVPIAYAFNMTEGFFEGSFLLLLTLSLGVPTAYDEYWPTYDRTWKAMAWILVAVGIAATEFIATYVFGTEVVALSSLMASLGAFLVAWPGNLVVLFALHRSN